MRTHLAEDEIEQLNAGAVPPAEIAAIGRHLSACEECAAKVSARMGLPRMVSDVRIQIEADRGAPERFEERPAGNRHRWMFAVAASLALVALMTLISTARRARPVTQTPIPNVATDISAAPPVPIQAPASYGRPEWDRWVAEAVRTNRLEMPAMLAALRPPNPQHRGEAAADDQLLRPNGVVVDELRPRFQWRGREEARYVVVVALDDDRIVESKELDQPFWQPPFDLKRGREYAWQVEIMDGTRRTTHPRAPRPPARFRILDEDASSELEEARRRFPNDPLLHAVLFARHGLAADAKRSLLAYRKSGRPELADALLRSVHRWNEAGVPPSDE